MIKFIILLFCLSSCLVSFGACPEQIKAFYFAYMSNLLHNDNSKNDALCETYMTKALIQKVQRITCATGADAIIRAQDINENAIKTLSVKDLGEGWYLVNYRWEEGGILTEIPLKAQDINDKCKITYITPIWNGSDYGDRLLPVGNANSDKINQKSGTYFLESFYKAYLFRYCSMPENLWAILSSLRSQYLTQHARQEFNYAESDNLQDGLEGYDLLINDFDFDCLWCSSLLVSHLYDNLYVVEYKSGDKVNKITITLTNEENKYFIDRISIK